VEQLMKRRNDALRDIAEIQTKPAVEVFEQAAKMEKQKVMQELTEKVAKEVAEQLLKESGEKLAKEVGERLMKEALKQGAKKLGLKAVGYIIPGLNIVMIAWDVVEISYGIYKIYQAHNDPDRDKKVMGGTGKEEPKNPNNVALSPEEKKATEDASNGNVSAKTKALLKKASSNVQKIWLAITVGKGGIQPLTEVQVKRFLALIPPDISDEQTAALLKKASNEEVDFEKMMSSLEQVFKEENHKNGEPKETPSNKEQDKESSGGNSRIASIKELEAHEGGTIKANVGSIFVKNPSLKHTKGTETTIELFTQDNASRSIYIITDVEATVTRRYYWKKNEGEMGELANDSEATHMLIFYKIKTNKSIGIPFPGYAPKERPIIPAGAELVGFAPRHKK
ncbi:MAG: hypothetical protein AAF734_10775, partial [Bacteroidota bacterium]